MLVRIQSSALISQTGLAGVLGSMAVFETVGPGSIPGRVTGFIRKPLLKMFSECAGSHATLRRSQTRFDSWREHLLNWFR